LDEFGLNLGRKFLKQSEGRFFDVEGVAHTQSESNCSSNGTISPRWIAFSPSSSVF
jgi:hypothetical protein